MAVKARHLVAVSGALVVGTAVLFFTRRSPDVPVGPPSQEDEDARLYALVPAEDASLLGDAAVRDGRPTVRDSGTDARGASNR